MPKPIPATRLLWTANSPARLFSSINSRNNNLYKLKIPKHTSEDLYDEAAKFLEEASVLKKATHETLIYQANKSLEKFPKEFLEELEHVKGMNHTIVEITGWDFPEFNPKYLPKDQKDLENADFLRRIRPTQILLYMMNQALGIKLIDNGTLNGFV
jgi:hypothetical protein